MAMMRYRCFLRMISCSPRLSFTHASTKPLEEVHLPASGSELCSRRLGSKSFGSRYGGSLWMKAAACSLPSQGFGTESGSEESLGRSETQRDAQKIVIYRGRWMRPIRLLVRLKLFQLGGIAALVVPLAEYSQQGSLTLGTFGAALAVIGGAGGASAALWYYSRRYVGELALLPPYPNCIKISVLDFWGNREDLQYDLRQVVPSLKDLSDAERERLAYQAFVPLDVTGGRQFILSLRYGALVDKDLLFALLCGTLEMK